jgi:hypothetical protein
MAYFANATEGDQLEMQCETCPVGDEACPIKLVQLVHNYDQCGNDQLKQAMNVLIDEEGQCQMLPLLLKRASQ